MATIVMDAQMSSVARLKQWSSSELATNAVVTRDGGTAINIKG